MGTKKEDSDKSKEKKGKKDSIDKKELKRMAGGYFGKDPNVGFDDASHVYRSFF